MSYTPTEEEKKLDNMRMHAFKAVDYEEQKQKEEPRKPKRKYPSNYTPPKKKRKK